MLRRGLMLAGLLLLTIAVSTPWATSEQAKEEAAVPAYNPPPAPGAKLPAILGRDQLWGNNDRYPYQSHAYELAAKIQKVIYQQPCYCYCDRGMGHNSLHSCFENTHGAQCDVCMKELYYSYAQTKKGKTAAQIRQGITKGEWKQVDLESSATMN